jgi:hypothetical protein
MKIDAGKYVSFLWAYKKLRLCAYVKTYVFFESKERLVKSLHYDMVYMTCSLFNFLLAVVKMCRAHELLRCEQDWRHYRNALTNVNCRSFNGGNRVEDEDSE